MGETNEPSCFVATIDVKLADKLRQDLIHQGFELVELPHTFFSAKKKGISCTLYQSGKLTVQGKEKNDFIIFYLEPEILKNVSYSYRETLISTTPRIGVDEAGKGDFFGPLCIAGVFAGDDSVKRLIELNVRDSKRIGDAAILTLATRIRAEFPYHLVRLFPEKYNTLYASFRNLNQLLAWGHATVIEQLVSKTRCPTVLIDQFAHEHLVENALKRKQIDVDLTQRPRGEEDLVVAAASILARAAFLEGLESLSKEVGVTLPKGASDKVIEIGKALVTKEGSEILQKVGKLHFKTRDVILQ